MTVIDTNTRSHVLIVEDEVGLAELLYDYLEDAGYTAHMLHRGTGVVEWVKAHSPNMILLDLMLPGKDGMEICNEVRRFSEVPIIMTTARVEEIDRLLGLNVGADDYICKPYSPREVVARVKAVLRRATFADGKRTAVDTGILLDETTCRVSVKGVMVELTPVEFRLLKTLLAEPGRAFSRGDLLGNLYADHRIVSERTVDTHIKNLRKKLEASQPELSLIRSIYGVGYTLEPAT